MEISWELNRDISWDISQTMMCDGNGVIFMEITMVITSIS